MTKQSSKYSQFSDDDVRCAQVSAMFLGVAIALAFMGSFAHLLLIASTLIYSV